MARLDTISFTSLFTIDALNQLVFSFVFGTTIWISFFGGMIAYKTLPRPQFGILSSKTFAVYFPVSIISSLFLLGSWIFNHPDVVPNITKPWVADVAQVYTLGTVLVAQGFNQFYFSPQIQVLLHQRNKLEREEGKSPSEAGISEEMKALNKKFGAAHGLSSSFNLLAVVALVFHGLWIGNHGLRKY